MVTFMKTYGWIMGNMLWINMVLAILLIFFERRKPTTTLLWIMVLMFLPGIGFLLYLFLGQDLSKKKMFKTKEEEDAQFKERLTTQYKNIDSGMLQEKDPNLHLYEDLVKMHIKSSGAYYSKDNEIEIFFTGEDKFNALIHSIRNAKEYIYIQYYIFKSDGLGTRIIDELIKKAEEGVEVKFLVDGMGGRNLSRNAKKRMKDSGIDVAVFFPPLFTILEVRINYRNHRKLCIVDGKEAFVGGFNVGDEYIGLYKKFGNWRDTHIKIKGTAVSSLQWRFFLDWRFASHKKITREIEYIVEESDDKAGVQIVSSGPDSKWPNVKDGYLKMITDAKDRVYIETPYFIPDASMFEALRVAALSSVDVRVMIPDKPDHIFVYWAGMSYIGELLQAGVKFYTYNNGFLHSKVFISDYHVSSVGTANLDIRSFQLNFEVNAFIYDEEVNHKLAENFIKDLDLCTEITQELYSQRSLIVKMKESFSRLLSPIL